MKFNDVMSSNTRAHLNVAAAGRERLLGDIYSKIAKSPHTGRMLEPDTFLLADILARGVSRGFLESDLVFAEWLAGVRIETGKIVHERSRWRLIEKDPTLEYPDLYDHMNVYYAGRQVKLG